VPSRSRTVTSWPGEVSVSAIAASSSVDQADEPVSRRRKVRSEIPVLSVRACWVTPRAFMVAWTLPAISALSRFRMRELYPDVHLSARPSGRSGSENAPAIVYHGPISGILKCVTTANISPLTVSIAAIIRASMAKRTPAWSQRELQRATGITQSTLSRLLAPTQVMNINQLDAICQALELDAGEVMDSARKAVNEHEADKLRGQVRGLPSRGNDHRAG
jgi:DNA-binding Xre family transcriptional regulator